MVRVFPCIFTTASFPVWISVLPDHSHSSPHGFRWGWNFLLDFNLRWAFVRVSLRGVCKSVGLRFGVLMSMYKRALHSSPQSAVGKILWTFQCPFQQPMRTPPAPPPTFALWRLSARSPSKVLLTCISDSYANETKIQPLKEKSTSSKSARWNCWEKLWRLHQWFLVSILAVYVLGFMWGHVRRQNVTSPDLFFLGYNVAVVLWQSMKSSTELVIVSFGRKAWLPPGFILLSF